MFIQRTYIAWQQIVIFRRNNIPLGNETSLVGRFNIALGLVERGIGHDAGLLGPKSVALARELAALGRQYPGFAPNL